MAMIKRSKISYLDNTEYKKHLSRYNVLRRINDSDTNVSYLETQNQKKVPESTSDRYHSVTVREENRLDLIAKDYYNDPTLWWAIAMANNLIDPFNIPVGKRLRIPPSSTLNFQINKILNR